MNEVLIEAFQQKDWAMKTLIAACEGCSVDELRRPAAGFGSILATLNHLVSADAGYVASLGGGRAVWAVADSETNDLQELIVRVEENGARWKQILHKPVDGESLAFLDIYLQIFIHSTFKKQNAKIVRKKKLTKLSSG